MAILLTQPIPGDKGTTGG